MTRSRSNASLPAGAVVRERRSSVGAKADVQDPPINVRFWGKADTTPTLGDIG
jgi:hypothetical protein